MPDSTPPKPHVLAVDDEEHITELVAMALGIHGFEVERVGSGRAARAALEASRPDLVLLDISLPGMDGNEILAHIRDDEHLRLLPVIALTAHAMAGDREKYLAAGFNDYITKPIVDETLLLKAMEKWIAKAREGAI